MAHSVETHVRLDLVTLGLQDLDLERPPTMDPAKELGGERGASLGCPPRCGQLVQPNHKLVLEDILRNIAKCAPYLKNTLSTESLNVIGDPRAAHSAAQEIIGMHHVLAELFEAGVLVALLAFDLRLDHKDAFIEPHLQHCAMSTRGASSVRREMLGNLRLEAAECLCREHDPYSLEMILRGLAQGGGNVNGETP